MFDLDSEDFQPGTERHNWLKDVRRANMKTDCADYRQYRLFGNAFMIGNHRVEFFSKKKNANTVFNHLCPKLNPATCKYDRVYTDGPNAGKPVECPYCDAPELGKKPSNKYLIHAIDRVLQRSEPNPVVVLSLPETVMIQLWNKKKFNVVDGKQYSVAHADYGFDIYLKFNPNGKAMDMYSVETGNAARTPLSDVERQYRTYDLARLYSETGVKQADPAEFRTFLERVGLIKSTTPSTQMPSGGFGNMDDDLPPSYGGPIMGSGGFGGQPAPSGFVPPPSSGGFTPPQSAQGGGFVPPTQMPSSAGFVPPTSAGTAAGPSSRFSGPPTQEQQQPAAPAAVPQSAALPDCYKNTDFQGLPACLKCPVKRQCLAD